MKIISKVKDYYDFVAGIQGIDPHVVYDRRNCKIFDQDSVALKHNNVIKTMSRLCFRIGYTAYVIEKYRSDIKLIDTVPLFKYKDVIDSPNNCFFLFKEDTRHFREIPSYSRDTVTSIYTNIAKNLDKTSTGYILNDSIITQFVSPEEAYNNIYEYFLSKKEINIVDTSTDLQKLARKGFDKITSFRHPIK